MNLYLSNQLIIFILCLFLLIITIISIYLVNERINRPIVPDTNTNTETDSDTDSIINVVHV